MRITSWAIAYNYAQLLVVSNTIDGEQETSDLHLQEFHEAKQSASFVSLYWKVFWLAHLVLTQLKMVCSQNYCLHKAICYIWCDLNTWIWLDQGLDLISKKSSAHNLSESGTQDYNNGSELSLHRATIVNNSYKYNVCHTCQVFFESY